MSRRRVALLGGSFNPPHIAHQMICLWVLTTQKTDEVWLLPCFQHPLGKQLVAFEHRIHMAQLLGEFFPASCFKVSEVEAHIPSPSKTLFTLKRLRSCHEELEFSLVVGADILQEKHLWYRFDEIESIASLIVVGRQGYPTSEEPGIVLPPISSSLVRKHLSQGQSVDAWVPRKILDYIHENGLYVP